MFKKLLLVVLAVSLGFISSLSYAQSTTTSTTTTLPKKGQAVTETTVTTPAAARPTYDQEALKKMNDTLCVSGFDAKVGNDNKNLCLTMATPPDIAYTCVWQKKGEGAYPATPQGPCRLDNTQHRGAITVEKATYKESPPLPYGTKAECCFRAAKGPATTSTSTTIAPAPKK